MRPPRTVEYICLACGAQGSVRREADGGREGLSQGGFSLKCPKCGESVLYLEREAAEDFGEALHVGKA